ncbi:mucin-5AC-like [Daktulosphaira vitifoliae]|uniref:mucin-5AC-like n=1 Tax=Daktulosphaira vitifoliae TaxID=58002 RepID=UPI0021AAE1EC|nr:mucin-5AC-like [Daktulosphaira vitifoliae]
MGAFRRRRYCTAVVLALLPLLTLADPSAATSANVSVSVTGSTVNSWLLPRNQFPVFYRLFRDRVTWFEADAVCQFHHAQLATVETSDQYEAVRTHLKRLDAAENVWIGLKRNSDAGEFAWTNYRPLANGGRFREEIPRSPEPLCVVTDPAANFKWHTMRCGGPEVASFVCELPVPSWAANNSGCMTDSVETLTVAFLPERAAIELTKRCAGGVWKSAACRGNTKRSEIVEALSCPGLNRTSSSSNVRNVVPLKRITTEETVKTKTQITQDTADTIEDYAIEMATMTHYNDADDKAYRSVSRATDGGTAVLPPAGPLFDRDLDTNGIEPSLIEPIAPSSTTIITTNTTNTIPATSASITAAATVTTTTTAHAAITATTTTSATTTVSNRTSSTTATSSTSTSTAATVSIANRVPSTSAASKFSPLLLTTTTAKKTNVTTTSASAIATTTTTATAITTTTATVTATASPDINTILAGTMTTASPNVETTFRTVPLVGSAKRNLVRAITVDPTDPEMSATTRPPSRVPFTVATATVVNTTVAGSSTFAGTPKNQTADNVPAIRVYKKIDLPQIPVEYDRRPGPTGTSMAAASSTPNASRTVIATAVVAGVDVTATAAAITQHDDRSTTETFTEGTTTTTTTIMTTPSPRTTAAVKRHGLDYEAYTADGPRRGRHAIRSVRQLQQQRQQQQQHHYAYPYVLYRLLG